MNRIPREEAIHILNMACIARPDLEEVWNSGKQEIVYEETYEYLNQVLVGTGWRVQLLRKGIRLRFAPSPSGEWPEEFVTKDAYLAMHLVDSLAHEVLEVDE